MKWDKPACALALSAALTLGSASILLCPTARAGSPPTVTPSAPAPSVPPADSDGDGDGDELLEHWGNPVYAREERFQMTALTVLLLAGGTLRAARRRALRRRLPHG